MNEINIRNILFYFIVLFGLFGLFGFIFSKNFLEGFDTVVDTNKSDSFCKSHIGSSDLLNESCNKLTQKNCNSTSCCVWTNNNKCVAGSENGPTYNTDKNGKTIDLDYYYYKNKCYGTKCP